jgi:hypothetical protein
MSNLIFNYILKKTFTYELLRTIICKKATKASVSTPQNGDEAFNSQSILQSTMINRKSEIHSS